MTTTTHTPGPWKVETWKYKTPAREVLTINTKFDAIAQTCGLWRDGDDSANEEEANARLIAAAPDLLAALESQVSALDSALSAYRMGERSSVIIEHARAAIEAARDAIDKATISATRSSCTCDAECNGPVPNYCSEHDGDYSAFLAASNCD